MTGTPVRTGTAGRRSARTVRPQDSAENTVAARAMLAQPH